MRTMRGAVDMRFRLQILSGIWRAWGWTSTVETIWVGARRSYKFLGYHATHADTHNVDTSLFCPADMIQQFYNVLCHFRCCVAQKRFVTLAHASVVAEKTCVFVCLRVPYIENGLITSSTKAPDNRPLVRLHCRVRSSSISHTKILRLPLPSSDEATETHYPLSNPVRNLAITAAMVKNKPISYSVRGHEPHKRA